MNLLISALLLLAPSDTVEVAHITAAYREVIDVVRHGGGENAVVGALVRRSSAVPEGNPLRGFLRDNPYLLTYLVHNATTFDEAAIFSTDRSFEQQRADYYDALLTDPQFRRVADGLIASYLEGQGVAVPDAPFLERRIMTAEAVQTLAVRFFYPDDVRDDGTLTGHICSGINGISDYPNRDLVVEGAAYAAIFEELRANRDRVWEEFGAALREAEALALSEDFQVKVVRVQGVVWEILKSSEYLRSLLIDYMRSRGDWIPITVVGSGAV